MSLVVPAPRAIRPLSPIQRLLYPLLMRLARNDAQEQLERRAKHTTALMERKAARRDLEKQLKKEARIYRKILTECWTRLGSHSPRHSPGGPETMPAQGSRRRRVERVRFQWIGAEAETIYFKILTRRRGLFGYRNALPYRVRVWDLICEETILELSFACERVISAVYEDPRKGAWIRVHRLEGVGGLPTKVTFNDVLENYPLARVDQAPVVLGVGDHRRVHTISLAAIPHVLVAGSSGSGKSNIVNHILCSLIRFSTPDQLQLVLIDLKRMEFNYYNELPHLKQAVIFNADDALAALQLCIKEVAHRTELMSAQKIKELAAWNRKYPDRAMPRWLVVIDEFAELMLASGKEVARETENSVTRITNLGRAVGIHMLICTQRPAVQIVPNSIKINMPLILAGRTPTAAQSGVILGDGDAAHLPAIPGRMIALTGSDKQAIQTPYISDEIVAECVAIARGRAAGLIKLDGTGVAIEDAGLLAKIVTEGGSLTIQKIYDLVKESGITTSQVKGFVAAVIKAGRIEIGGRTYQVTRRGNGHYLAGAPVIVPPLAELTEPEPPPQQPDQKTVALEMWRDIRRKRKQQRA